MLRRVLVLLLVVGCGGEDGSAGSSDSLNGQGGQGEPPGGTIIGSTERMEGFDIPSPAAGQLQVWAPIARGILPAADVTLCDYLDFRAEVDYDISDYQGYQSAAGHHVILYAVPNPQEPGTRVCTEADMINSRFIAAGGAEAGKPVFPEGIVLRLPAGSQLMVQSHWINTSNETVDAQSALNVQMAPSSGDNIVGDLFTVVTTQVELPSSSASSARAECVIPEDMMYFMLGGHAHEHATHLTITFSPANAPSEIVYDTEWGPEYDLDPPRYSYPADAPFVVHAGDRFTLDCMYQNDTAEAILFPQEMCAMFAYYFPADRELNCVNGVWPAP